jgi:hypothetical protein
MGKHATIIDKVVLTHLLYIHQAKAARKAGLAKSTVIDIKNLAINFQIRYNE